MRTTRTFYIVFVVLFAAYIVAELNRPKTFDWTVSLSRSDKNPYGSYVLFEHLSAVFKERAVQVVTRPPYNFEQQNSDTGAVYLLASLFFNPPATDVAALKKFVQRGNHVLIASGNFGKTLAGEFGLSTATRVALLSQDTPRVNLANPGLRRQGGYGFLPQTMDAYFSKPDTAKALVLGVTDRQQPNFIRVQHGKGYFYFHAAPLCFSNYFMLFQNNAAYTAACLSYLPARPAVVYWDEFFKPNQAYAETPLRFFLNNTYLLWATRLALLGLLVFIVFGTKRRQRVIPVIEPLRNASLDFVHTVSSVYFNQRDNQAIAAKKVNYFLDVVRHRFYLPANELNDAFVEALTRKSGVPQHQVAQLVQLLAHVHQGGAVGDDLLVQLDYLMDQFYKQL